MNRSIAYGRQKIGLWERLAVDKVLRGDWLTQGPEVARFESEFADEVEASFAVAFSSGSAALQAAAFAGGISAGDIVLTSPLTFAATVSSVLHLGAKVKLGDIEPTSWNFDMSSLGVACDLFLPVHFAGLPLDLNGIKGMPQMSSSPLVIEDAAHALGAHTPSGPVGNCANSDMVCFSLHPVKSITTGEGGMVTTNNSDLYHRLLAYRNHGISRLEGKPAWFYDVSFPGMNFRLTDIQASMGRVQLRRLREFVERRAEMSARYRQAFSGLPLNLQAEPPRGFSSAHHLFVVLTDSRDALFEFLRHHGVNAQVHYRPIHHHSAFSDIEILQDPLRNVESYYRTALSLPLYPGLKKSQQKYVIDVVRKFFDI